MVVLDWNVLIGNGENLTDFGRGQPPTDHGKQVQTHEMKQIALAIPLAILVSQARAEEVLAFL